MCVLAYQRCPCLPTDRGGYPIHVPGGRFCRVPPFAGPPEVGIRVEGQGRSAAGQWGRRSETGRLSECIFTRND